jgi:hypothetical protein
MILKFLSTGPIRTKIKLAQQFIVLALSTPNLIEISLLVLEMKREDEQILPHKAFICTKAAKNVLYGLYKYLSMEVVKLH